MHCERFSYKKNTTLVSPNPILKHKITILRITSVLPHSDFLNLPKMPILSQFFFKICSAKEVVYPELGRSTPQVSTSFARRHHYSYTSYTNLHQSTQWKFNPKNLFVPSVGVFRHFPCIFSCIFSFFMKKPMELVCQIIS